jgi:hypothetical protein
VSRANQQTPLSGVVLFASTKPQVQVLVREIELLAKAKKAPTAEQFSGLLEEYSKQSNAAAVRTVYDACVKAGCVATLQADSTLLHALAEEGHVDDVLTQLKLMRQRYGQFLPVSVFDVRLLSCSLFLLLSLRLYRM